LTLTIPSLGFCRSGKLSHGALIGGFST